MPPVVTASPPGDVPQLLHQIALFPLHSPHDCNLVLKWILTPGFFIWVFLGFGLFWVFLDIVASYFSGSGILPAHPPSFVSAVFC